MCATGTLQLSSSLPIPWLADAELRLFMNTNTRQIPDLICGSAIAEADDAVSAGSTRNPICTRSERLQLALAWPSSGPETQTEVLDPLCRKIAVARQVWAEYDANWKKEIAQ